MARYRAINSRAVHALIIHDCHRATRLRHHRHAVFMVAVGHDGVSRTVWDGQARPPTPYGESELIEPRSLIRN